MGWRNEHPEDLAVSATPTNPLLRHVRRLADCATPPSDRELLHRFAAARDEDAFAEVVRRHAPMVLGVCERVLHSRHDAEDTAQACFLVLARKAGSLAWQPCVGPRLYQVAYRLSRKARVGGARRLARLATLAQRPVAVPPEEPSWRELHAVLDEELDRLPAKYRAPLVLCYLEGQTRDEAAQQLGCPLGTLKSRLERGRELLRARLGRRGVTLSAALAVVGLAAPAAQATPAELVGAVTAKAAALAQGALRGLALKVAALLAVGALAVGVGLLAHRAPAPQPAEPPPGQSTPAAKAGQPSRTDRHGDPLPDESLARLGTLRFRHGGLIRGLAFTPDGARLVAHGHDGVLVWDVATGKEVRRLVDAPAATWKSSLTGDGKFVAVVISSPEGVLIREVATGRTVRQFATRSVTSLALSPDGKVLAVLPLAGGLELWDSVAGSLLHSLATGPDQLWSPVFSADGKTVVAGSEEGAIGFWEVASGKEVRRIPSPGKATNVRLSPDGRTMAVITHTKLLQGRATVWTPDDRVRLLDAGTGKELQQLSMRAVEFSGGLKSGFTELAFAPGGKTLVTIGMDGVLRTWEVATGKELRQFSGFVAGVWAMTFSPNGKVLALGEGGSMVRLIDPVSGKDVCPTDGHRSSVCWIAVAPNGRTVVTGGWDHSLRFWDPATGRELRQRVLPAPGISAPQLLPGGKTYLWADAERNLRTYDLNTGEERPTLRGHDGQSTLALSPNGKTLAAATADNKAIRLIDPTTGKTLHTLDGVGPWLLGLAFTPDGRRLIAWSSDKQIARWDVATGKTLPSFSVPVDPAMPVPLPPGGNGPSFTAEFSPDGRFLVFGLQEGFLPVVDAVTGREIRRFQTAPDGACFFAFSPDGKTLAWAGWRDPTVYLGELATGKERHHFTGHRGRVTALAFTPDGKKLISGAEDTTALIWDLTGGTAAGNKPPQPLSPSRLDALWADLAGQDAATAYQAVRALAADPASSLAFLRARLRPAAAVDAKDVARRITELDSESFEVRERASRELQNYGEAALQAIRKALAGSPGPEARRRLEELVQRQEEETPSPQRLRALRAVEVLELVGTPESRAVLEALAEGAPGARLTEDARAVLGRLPRDAR
jgi:RNA polymerase sigma factor (sigma-70 family)